MNIHQLLIRNTDEYVMERNIAAMNDRIALEFRVRLIYGEPEFSLLMDDLCGIEYEISYSRFSKFEEFLLRLIRAQDWGDRPTQILLAEEGGGFLGVNRRVFCKD